MINEKIQTLRKENEGIKKENKELQEQIA